jgi:hypothetical protein
MSGYNITNNPANFGVQPNGPLVAEWGNVQHLPFTSDVTSYCVANTLQNYVNLLTVNTLIVGTGGQTSPLTVDLPNNDAMWRMLGSNGQTPLANSNLGQGDYVSWKIINRGSGAVTFRAPNLTTKTVAGNSEATLLTQWTTVSTTSKVYSIVF